MFRYHTTVVYGTTGEYATISNGELSLYRIINAARSPQAVKNFTMKFGLAVDAKTIEAFQEDLTAYVKSKPREWIKVSAFRIVAIEASLGYVEVKIVLQHRESWQQIGALLNSLADVEGYAFELSKKLNMTYKAPCMPIEMTLTPPASRQGIFEDNGIHIA